MVERFGRYEKFERFEKVERFGSRIPICDSHQSAT
jgi:hypothetical protein